MKRCDRGSRKRCGLHASRKRNRFVSEPDGIVRWGGIRNGRNGRSINRGCSTSRAVICDGANRLSTRLWCGCLNRCNRKTIKIGVESNRIGPRQHFEFLHTSNQLHSVRGEQLRTIQSGDEEGQTLRWAGVIELHCFVSCSIESAAASDGRGLDNARVVDTKYINGESGAIGMVGAADLISSAEALTPDASGSVGRDRL